jgi:predicted MFS family arabinose efflux permease
MLMSGILLVLAVTNLASAFAPDYGALLIVRLLMLVAAAPFTPQAASTIALIVSPERRPRAIAFVFLGWSLSLAVGVPLIGFLADRYGWRASFGILAGAAAVSFVLLAAGLPAALRGAPVSLASWGAIFRSGRILLLLLLTAMTMAASFGTFSFLGPLLKHFLAAEAGTISLFFALFGIAGLVGNLVATRIVGGIGALATTAVFLAASILGAAIWTFGAGAFVVMAFGAAVWGLGLASINSMQQARLIAAAPALASGSVALNTSAIYVGQAVGSGLGGLLIENAWYPALGYVAIGVLIACALVLVLTKAPDETLLPSTRP